MRTTKTSVDSTQPRLGADGMSGSDRLLALIAGGLIGIAFAQPLGAEELGLHGKNHPSETYLELIGYVQQVGDEQPSIVSPHQSPHNFTPIGDETYSALRNFVRQIGAEQPEPLIGNGSAHHSAPADDETYLALRDFVHEIGGDEPAPAESNRLLLAEAAQPKTAQPAKKAVKPAKPINPDDATYVGSQVCTGCHANQSARFGQTVMGKIFLKNPRKIGRASGRDSE